MSRTFTRDHRPFPGLAAWMSASQAMGHGCSFWVLGCGCFPALLYLVFFSRFLRDPALQENCEAELLCHLCPPPVGTESRMLNKKGCSPLARMGTALVTHSVLSSHWEHHS